MDPEQGPLSVGFIHHGLRFFCKGDFMPRSDTHMPDMPLQGRRILLTRPEPQTTAWKDRLIDLGADVLVQPMLAITPVFSSEVAAALDRLSQFEWIIFTSQNGVEAFCEALRRRALPPTTLAFTKLAAVGSATAHALERKGFVVHLTPEQPSALALAQCLRPQLNPRQKVLFIRAEQSRPELDELLSPVCDWHSVPFYRQEPGPSWRNEVIEQLAQGRMDYVLLSSGNIAEAFLQRLTPPMWAALQAGRPCLVSISANTTQRIKQLAEGKNVFVREATHSSFDGMMQVLLEDVQKQGRSAGAK